MFGALGSSPGQGSAALRSAPGPAALPANPSDTAAPNPTGPAASRSLESHTAPTPGPPCLRNAQHTHPTPTGGHWDLCLALVRRRRRREGTKVTSPEEVRDDTATTEPESQKPLPAVAPHISGGEGMKSALSNTDPLWICENY